MENQDIKIALKNFVTSLVSLLKLLFEAIKNKIKNVDMKKAKADSQDFLTFPNVSKVCAVLATLTTLMWFLPLVSVFGESLNIFGLVDFSSSDQAAGWWITVVLYAVSVIWAVIPEKWSVIVGMIYSLFMTTFSIGQVSEWNSDYLDLAIGGKLLIPLSVFVLIASAMRLNLVLKDAKQGNASAKQSNTGEKPDDVNEKQDKTEVKQDKTDAKQDKTDVKRDRTEAKQDNNDTN